MPGPLTASPGSRFPGMLIERVGFVVMEIGLSHLRRLAWHEVGDGIAVAGRTETGLGRHPTDPPPIDLVLGQLDIARLALSFIDLGLTLGTLAESGEHHHETLQNHQNSFLSTALCAEIAKELFPFSPDQLALIWRKRTWSKILSSFASQRLMNSVCIAQTTCSKKRTNWWEGGRLALLVAAAVAALLAALVALALAVVGPADGRGELGPALLALALGLLAGGTLLLAELGRLLGRTESRQPPTDLVEVLGAGRTGRTALDGPRRVVGAREEPVAVLGAPQEAPPVAVRGGEELGAGLLQGRELVLADSGDRHLRLAVQDHEVLDSLVAALAAAAVRHSAAVDVAVLGLLDPHLDRRLAGVDREPEGLDRLESRDPLGLVLGLLPGLVAALRDEELGVGPALGESRGLTDADPDDRGHARDLHHHEVIDHREPVLATPTSWHAAGELALRSLPDLGSLNAPADALPVAAGQIEGLGLGVHLADLGDEVADLEDRRRLGELPLRLGAPIAEGGDLVTPAPVLGPDLDDPPEADLAHAVAARVTALAAHPDRLGLRRLGHGRDGRLGLLRLRRLDDRFLDHLDRRRLGHHALGHGLLHRAVRRFH